MKVREFKERLERLPLGLDSAVWVEVNGKRYPLTDIYEEIISTEDRNEKTLCLSSGKGEQLTLGNVTHFLLDFVDPASIVMTGTEDDMEGLACVMMQEKYGIHGSDKSVLLARYEPYLSRVGGYND